MTALAANVGRVYKDGPVGSRGFWPVLNGVHIYQGSLCVLTNLGFVKPVGANPDEFPVIGFAMEECDNTLGAAGAIQCEIRQAGQVQLVITGTELSVQGTLIYASTDNDFTLTSTDNILVGKLVYQAAASSTTWFVAFEAFHLRSV